MIIISLYKLSVILIDYQISVSHQHPEFLAASVSLKQKNSGIYNNNIMHIKQQKKLAKMNGKVGAIINKVNRIYRNIYQVTKHLMISQRYSRGHVTEKIESVTESLILAVSSFSAPQEDGYNGKDERFTFLINCQHECVFNKLESVLKTIQQSQKLKNNPILIATSRTKIFKQILKKHVEKLPALEFIDVTEIDSYRMIYKKMFGKVSTDMVFFTRLLTKLPTYLFTEKHIKLLTSKSLDVLGSAITTNDKKLWDTGCYKTRMLLYQYRITKGYDELDPNQGTVRCEYIAGPFLARSKVIKRYLNNRYIGIAVADVPMFRAPDSFFTKEVFYLDLFNHLQSSSRIVKVSILDTATIRTPSSSNLSSRQHQLIDPVRQLTREQIRPFMVKNQLSRYISSVSDSGTAVEYTFKCGEVNINGGAYLMMTNNGMFIPKCAIDELNELLLFSTRIFDKYGFTYELDSGSVVGQTKLSATLPWERDHDLVFKPEYFRHLAKLNDTFINKAGYTLHAKFDELDLCIANNSMECGYVGIRSKTWRIELVGQSVIGSNMYRTIKNKLYTNARKSLDSRSSTIEKIQKTNHQATTRGQVGGQWLSVPPNPGLYTRSKYGLDVLRHQQHWADVGGINSWMAYNKAGKWMKCKRVGHHSCSNNFLADGNLIFYDVWF